MLEKYEKDFDENEFMRSFMERKQISTKKQALAELRKLIKKEGYYQTKIKEALKKRYPDAFVAKISQGAYRCVRDTDMDRKEEKGSWRTKVSILL